MNKIFTDMQFTRVVRGHGTKYFSVQVKLLLKCFEKILPNGVYRYTKSLSVFNPLIDHLSTYPIQLQLLKKLCAINSLLTIDLVSEQCYLFVISIIDRAIKYTDLCFSSPPLLLAFLFVFFLE